MDAQEARQIMDSARDALAVSDYRGAYDLAFPLHQSGFLTGTDQGEAAYLVGEACYGLGSMDAAKYYLEEAAGSASSATQQQARTRLTDVDQLDTAIGAPEGGITAQEARTIIEAGNDALSRGDYDGARGYFQQVYDAPGLPLESTAPAGLGLARCYAYDGDLHTADQYAAFAETDASTETAAKELRRWIKEQGEAGTAAADGVTPDELRPVMFAAVDAYSAGQWDEAYLLFDSIYTSSQAPTGVRGAAAYNVGLSLLHTQDYDAAHQYFTEAASIGPPDTVSQAQQRLQELANRDAAMEIVDDQLAEFVD